MLRTQALLLSVAFARAGIGGHEDSSIKLLFFDGRWVSGTANLSAAVGRPRLLSTFHDPSSFTGWGYPSVWARRDGHRGWHMAYNGDYASEHYPRTVLLAESTDGVNWRASSTSMLSLSPRLAPNELSAGGFNLLHPQSGKGNADVRSCAAKYCTGKAAGCLVCIDVERGTVFDDGPAQPLRMLLSNSSFLQSDDGLRWTLAGQWRPTGMDPMIGAFRTHTGELCVTSRPGGALRKEGRHLGAARVKTGAIVWSSMAHTEPSPLLPIDMTFRDNYQMYGMPTYPWDDGSNTLHVAFVVRMVPGPLATGKDRTHSGIGALLSGKGPRKKSFLIPATIIFYLSLVVYRFSGAN